MNLSLIYRLLCCHLLFFLCYSSHSKSVDSITTDDIEAALKRAQEKVKAQEKLHRELAAKGNVLNPSAFVPEAIHQLKSENLGFRIDNSATAILEAATQDLVSRFGLSKDDIKKLSKIPLVGEIGRQITQQCNDARPTNCDPNSKYRTIDGRCNNLERPNEGRIGSCHERLIPNDYEDGISVPRSQDNRLPSPRKVSINVHRLNNNEEDTRDPYLSTLFMSFGQWLVHDMLFSVQPQTTNNSLINCCPPNAQNHAECFPIILSADDPDFTPRNCMNFVRNQICPQCALGTVRQQMNALTSFIDCSQVYGTTDDQAASLRSNNNDGKLASRIIAGVGEMPLANLGPQLIPCGRPPEFPCFLVGDFRGNQNLLLLLNHICWFRLHNLIADKLKAINPHWDGERLYQEARRIVIAFSQHVVFFEYLPPLIGFNMMDSFSLRYTNTQYNSFDTPRLANTFAAAGFRVPHSTVPNTFLRLTDSNEYIEVPLNATFFDPMIMYRPGVVQDLARGAFTQCHQFRNNFLDRSVTQFLYVRPNATPGLDLASINIQRGRDHGLPGFTAYLERIFGVQIRDFSCLKEKLICSDCTVHRLESVYRYVKDIDLWTGLISERCLPDALVGPVSAFIIAEQFFRLKYCDRFFYTHQGQSGSFTYAQKQAIMSITLGRIMCDVFGLQKVAERPLTCCGQTVSCTNNSPLPKIDLSAWKEPRR